MFRSSRPDSIETVMAWRLSVWFQHCSGLLGRTPLRLTERTIECPFIPILFRSSRPDSIETVFCAARSQRLLSLFRSSRPDSIETESETYRGSGEPIHCSGLLGRTPLRPDELSAKKRHFFKDCSGLLGRTPLRRAAYGNGNCVFESDCSGLLGRTPLRPSMRYILQQHPLHIVPVF